MALRTETQTLDMLNIATEDLMLDTVSQVNGDTVVSARLLKDSEEAEGEQISIPLIVAEESVQAMGKYDPYNLQPQEILDKARYPWRRLNMSMVLDDMAVDVQNIGKAQLIDLAKTKVQNGTESLKNKFATLLFAAAVGANEPENLIKLVSTKNNTVGGIDASVSIGGSGTITLPYSWNPKVTDDTDKVIEDADLRDPTSPYSAEKILAKQYALQTYGTDHPTMALCTRGFFDAYEYVLGASKRYDGKAMEVAGGFTGLRFRDMVLVVDDNVPGGKLNTVANYYGQVIFLNEKYLGYRHAAAFDFKWTPWFRMEQQPVYASHLDWAGNFICSRRERQGAYIGIPTDLQLGLA